ncbi:MAG TPA: hypothetical protein VFC04_09615 [Actinomycetota bacterium]|jgi:hypothetical protein|nr:hypothetical protein [Actinomycetota bacterium]
MFELEHMFDYVGRIVEEDADLIDDILTSFDRAFDGLLGVTRSDPLKLAGP